MQSHQAHETAYYRCRYPNEYALANHVQHPRNVYVAERDIVPALDNWLLKAFAPHRLTDTIRRLHAAQPDTGSSTVAPEIAAANKIIVMCDAKLVQYRAIADAGGDPATVAAWMAEVNAQRAAALARRNEAAREPSPRRLTENDIRRLVGSFDDIRNIVRDARSEDKSNVYRELRLALTYEPGANKISVEAKPDADYCGVTVRVRGGFGHVNPAHPLENGVHALESRRRQPVGQRRHTTSPLAVPRLHPGPGRCRGRGSTERLGRERWVNRRRGLPGASNRYRSPSPQTSHLTARRSPALAHGRERTPRSACSLPLNMARAERTARTAAVPSHLAATTREHEPRTSAGLQASRPLSAADARMAPDRAPQAVGGTARACGVCAPQPTPAMLGTDGFALRQGHRRPASPASGLDVFVGILVAIQR
ncbi:hypothetical protein [Plantactinospora sp. KBS50]|uniref:hypothetical protein n=1 Tax=Plantactinospora sp. KBS50 TaxID=2024580 RepID=UPI001E2EEF0C|nr:hypothetical protein [Plantactinospora sp. KBS50]